VSYPDLKYTCQVTQDDSVYDIKITKTNISNNRLIVMRISDYQEDSFIHFSEFHNDTLEDFIDPTEIMHCDGPCTFKKILEPDSSITVGFKIRTGKNQFYFYEKYWFAEASDKEDKVRWIPLKQRKETVVCFPVILK